MTWADPEGYDEFDVSWRHGGVSTPFRATTEEQRFVIERAQGGRVYQVGVRGRHVGRFNDCNRWRHWFPMV